MALLLGTIIMVSPFVVMLVVSLVPTQAFLARNFSPSNFSPVNYIYTFEQVPFGRYYINSIIVTVTVTILQITIASLAAFAFARFPERQPQVVHVLDERQQVIGSFHPAAWLLSIAPHTSLPFSPPRLSPAA